MDIALIAPVPELGSIRDRTIHMALPELLRFESYKRFLREVRSDAFIILDNGAFEDASLGQEELLRYAAEYDVHEVIAPDTMKNADKTIDQVESFLYYCQSDQLAWQPRGVMAVVQGSTFEECRKCIREWAQPRYHRFITTLGIPKHLVTTTGWEEIRTQLAKWILTTYTGKWNIHFLGFTYPGEVVAAAHLGVRSMDTSMPYIAGAKAINVRLPDDASVIPARPLHYFLLPPKNASRMYTEANIRRLDDWAKGII